MSQDNSQFILDICAAAHRLNIGLREHKEEGLSYFSWYDYATNVLIECDKAKGRVAALELACHKLVDYLKFTPKNPPNETHR